MNAATVSKIVREKDVKGSMQSPGIKRGIEAKSSPPTEPSQKSAKSNGDISPGSLQSPENKVDKGAVDPKLLYENRTNRGKVVVDIKSQVEAANKGAAASAIASLSGSDRRCAISHFSQASSDEPAVGIQVPTRYMFTTTEQRSAGLERTFHVMQEQIFKHAGLPPELSTLRAPVGVPSQDAVVCFGRICCEASEGKINKTSVLLEGGRMEGGQRMKLILNELPNYALFPGQFVVVEGINSSGGRMNVRKLCEGVPRPLPRTDPGALNEMLHDTKAGCQAGAPLRIMMGSGPFCCTNNLDYAPLRDLLHQAVKGDPVDVLILTGPFIDSNHPQVSKGEIDMETEDGTKEPVDMATLFYFKVSGVIEAFVADNPGLNLQIVLVPSLSDAHHDVVYPQPPFYDRVPGGKPSPFYPDEKLFRLDIPFSSGGPAEKVVHCVGNPSMIKINEVVIGLTSTDVLMHLGKEEIAQKSVSSNRLERLVEHMLNQQSFYPVFPGSGSDVVPLDMQFNDKWRMPVSPDILIVPSRLATFARPLSNGTLAINPGQVAKGTSGGTYARLNIHPIPADHLEKVTSGGNASMPLTHQVAQRTSLQIKRI